MEDLQQIIDSYLEFLRLSNRNVELIKTANGKFREIGINYQSVGEQYSRWARINGNAQRWQLRLKPASQVYNLVRIPIGIMLKHFK